MRDIRKIIPIVTLIVVIILSGIIITQLSENLLSGISKKEKQKQDEAAVREKVELLLIEYQNEKLIKDDLRLLEFFKIKNNEKEIYSVKDNNDGTIEIILEMYKFKIDVEQHNIINVEISDDITFLYELSNYKNNKFSILIKIFDINGIDTIQFPDGDIQKCNGRKEIAIDYEVDEGKNYTFIARNIDGIEKTEVVNFTKPVEPVIPKIEIGYPIFTLTGVITDKIEIIYDEREEFLNYYSVDNGETWNLYTGPFGTTSKMIIAKSEHKKCQEIYTETRTTMNAPLDVLSDICYDGKTDKYQIGASLWINPAIQQLKCRVDSSTWGAKVRATMAQGNANIARSIYVYFYDSDNNLLDQIVQGCYYTDQVWQLEGIIPSGTEYVALLAESILKVYEFEIINDQ